MKGNKATKSEVGCNIVNSYLGHDPKISPNTYPKLVRLNEFGFFFRST